MYLMWKRLIIDCVIKRNSFVSYSFCEHGSIEMLFHRTQVILNVKTTDL